MRYIKDNIVNELYNSLNNSNNKKEHIKNHLLEINNDDIKRGWIYRYFAKQNNNPDAQILELDKKQYNKFKDNPFYKCIRIKWKIKGTNDNIKKTNYNIINDAQLEFPELKTLLEKKLTKYQFD